MSHKPLMHGAGKSDNPIVPAKDPNKGGLPPAEGLEGSGLVKENTAPAHMDRTQSRENHVPGLARCAGSRHFGVVSRQISKTGAVCGSAASTDLCGGRRVTAVPTATRVAIHREVRPRRSVSGQQPTGWRTAAFLLSSASAYSTSFTDYCDTTLAKRPTYPTRHPKTLDTTG